jgi:hypothetical protein
MIIAALAFILPTLAAPPPPPAAAGECVIIAPLDGAPETVVGGAECDRRTLPASTFKVPHALIALDTGVVSDSTTMTWDGTKQDFPVWEHDHTLDSAIKSSVVWFFQRAARSIGRDRELTHLRAFSYGSQTFSGPVDRFWLNGELTISPREQIAFPQADVFLPAADRAPARRYGDRGDDDAARQTVERLRRPRLRGRVATAGRSRQDGQWHRQGRAGELGDRRSRERRTPLRVREPRALIDPRAGDDGRRRPRASAASRGSKK